MRALLLLLALLAPAALAQPSPPSFKASDGRSARAPAAAAVADRPALGRPAIERSGGLAFYATRDAFDAAHPGLPVEDFEDIHVAPAPWCASFSPVDSRTDDDCYDRGTLMAPLAIAAVGPTQTDPDAVIALGEGYRVLDFPQPSTVVGANLAVDTTEVRFDPGVYAAGMDVYGYQFKSPVTVRVYDTEAGLLGTTTIPEARGGVFFGVHSDGAAIGAIRFAEVGDYVMLDDVAFGTVPGVVAFEPATLVETLESGTAGTGTVTLMNESEQAAAFSVVLAAAPTFVTSVTPSEATIPVGGSFDIEVTFEAAGLFAGTYVGSLLVETDLDADPNAFVLPVELHVTGTAACAITTGTITFDDTIVGTSSTAEATLANDGTDACALADATATGPFSVEGFETTSLAPGTSTTITLVYTPTEAGADAGTLTVTTDAGDLTASLQGTGLDAPTPAIEPGTLTFEVGVGETASQTFALSNVGGENAADLAYSIYVASARPAATTPPLHAKRGERRRAVAVTEGWTSSRPASADIVASYPAGEDLGVPRALFQGGGVTLTHSASQEIVPGYGVACPEPPTSWWRVFDLGEFGLDTELRISSVGIGIEAATEGTTTVNLYALDGELASSNLTLVATATLDVSPDDALSIATVPILATFDADAVVAVEWRAPQAGVLFGANPEGQTGPTYIQADACGAPEPFDIADVGFDLSHWVLNVHGETGPPLVRVTPESGSIAPGDSDEITVTVDATGFEPGTYEFELLIATNDPNHPTVTVDVTVNVGGVSNEGEGVPTVFALEQNYPNPFARGTTIRFALPEAAHVSVEVYDAVGRRVAVLVDGELGVGYHAARWEGSALASGVYLYRIQAGPFTKTLKMALVR